MKRTLSKVNYPILCIFLFSSCIFFITSCTTVAPAVSPESKPALTWDSRQKALAQLNRWQFSGKVAIKTSKDAGSASMDWTQNPQSYAISLYAPLGAGGVKLTGRPGLVTAQTSDGKTVSASTPEDLLAKAWGWRLPVSYIKYWIRGIPVPSLPAQTQFSNDRLQDLRQQGWHIQYLSYQAVGKLELPTKIYITSASLDTKIVIYNWNLA